MASFGFCALALVGSFRGGAGRGGAGQGIWGYYLGHDNDSANGNRNELVHVTVLCNQNTAFRKS